MSAPIGKNEAFHIQNASPEASQGPLSLEKTAAKLITSSQKTVLSSPTGSTSSGDGQMRLTHFLQNAGAIHREVSTRSEILHSLKTPLSILQNKRMKLRGGIGEPLKAKKRSILSIKSRIGGAESKEAVKNILTQLETASKLPNDPNHPQSIAKHLDELLNNEWFRHTIANDKSGALKNQFLDVLANEMILTPGIDSRSILSRLGVSHEALFSKLEDTSARKEPIQNMLALMGEEPDITTLKDLESFLSSAWVTLAVAKDSKDELKKPILDILTKVTLGYKAVKSDEINKILDPLRSYNAANTVNEFEEGLMDHAYNLAETFKCENSAIFRETFNSVRTDTKEVVQDSFLTSYHHLIETIQENFNANSFSPTRAYQGITSAKAEVLMEKAYEKACELGIENKEEFLEPYSKLEKIYLAEDAIMPQSFDQAYSELMKIIQAKIDSKEEISPFKSLFGAQYAESHEEAMESLKTHHYVIEKSGDKIIYHFDLIGSDGKQLIRSKELTDQAFIQNPAKLKTRLDQFIREIDSSKLMPKDT